MFCSKRNSLVKRLWKYKINDETKSSSQKDTSASSSSSSSKTTISSQEDLELKSVTHSFFKRLKEDQLKILVQAMESKGGEVTPCVPVSKSDLCLGRRMVSPYVLCCRVFRWPDLKSDVEMKRLPSCTRQNEEKESVICCNPYHWSLVVKIDEPPIQLDKLAMSPAQLQRASRDEINDDGYLRIMKSTESGIMTSVYQDDLTDNTEQSTGYDCLLWCTVAYWELRERVGRLFSVTEPSVHIFQHLPHGDGMCLKLFQKSTNLEVVKRTREKIGFGIILSREAAHKNNVNVIRKVEIDEAGKETTSALAAGIVVSSLQTSSNLLTSSSKLMSSQFRTAESVKDNQKIKSSSFPTTSYSEVVTSPVGVYKACDNLDLAHEVHDTGGHEEDRVSIGCDGRGFEHHHSDATCGIDQALYRVQEQHQHFSGSDSVHICCISNESMDCVPASLTSSQLCSQLPLPQPLSPCSPSSSSSSLSPSSPPMYISDTSVSYSHYSRTDSNHGAWVVNNATAHIINNNKTNNFFSSNSKNNSNKRATTGISTDSNNKNSRIMDSVSATRNTAAASTTETTTTSFTAISSNLPCKQGEVWAYNASNFPIFVNSPTLDDPKSPRSLVVKKVPPGYSIKIFDYARAELLERSEAQTMLLNDGPFDPCSVRISLAKGWGPSYSRQFITSCPCWLEVLLGVRSSAS